MTKTDQIIALMKNDWLSPYDALLKVGSFSLSQRVSRDISPLYHVEKAWRHPLCGGRAFRIYRIVGVKEGV